MVHECSTGSKNCTGVMCSCAVSPHGKKFNVCGLAGQGSTGPGLMVSQTGGAASFAQFVLGLARSARVVPPRFAVLMGYPIPSFPAAMQTPMEKMQAGPADPQSSSDQFPAAIAGMTWTAGMPRPFAGCATRVVAFSKDTFIPLLTGRLTASETALIPAIL